MLLRFKYQKTEKSVQGIAGNGGSVFLRFKYQIDEEKCAVDCRGRWQYGLKIQGVNKTIKSVSCGHALIK